jgi:hypothetical protein
MQPGLDKRLLGGIFGKLCIAVHAIDHIPDALGMDANQFAERVPFTVFRPDN